MASDQNLEPETIASLEKSRNFLQQKLDLEPSYRELIAKLDAKLQILKQGCQPVVALVSPLEQTGQQLQALSQADPRLRSLYDFELFSRVNIPKITKRCQLILLIYSAHQQINPQHRKLIKTARNKNIALFILVVRSQNCEFEGDLREWFAERGSPEVEQKLLLLDDFFDLQSSSQNATYQKALLEQFPQYRQASIQQHQSEAITGIQNFFNHQKHLNWQAIQQLKQEHLQGREVNYYQNHFLNKTFNKINQQLQQKNQALKQKIQQSRSNLLNSFIPEGWLFQLQDTIENAEVRLVKEQKTTYLYCGFRSKQSFIYLQEHILDLYQQLVTETLESQWHQLNYHDGEFAHFLSQARCQLAKINLLTASDYQSLAIDSEPFIHPQLALTDFIDPHCLKINSRIVFDYSYLQSNWFKLFMSAIIGVAIYLITKLYFGTGRFIGFYILIFQIINIITGQSIKKFKLKQHEKELRRVLNSQYQNLVRLIVDRLINTLIVSIEQQNHKYQQQLDCIAKIAQANLDAIEQEIEQLRTRKTRLEHDQDKLRSWLS